jgi:SAM-dependent methyltransferase
MQDAKGQVIGSAAEVYETFFVPALFQEWAPRLADALALAPGRTMLDVACGTGALAREAARRSRPQDVVGLDRNPGMLEVARRAAPAIEWRTGRAEELPFEPGRFDAVGCQFGLMFFDDRVRALHEMWRVVRPGGALAVAVWASLDETPGYAAVVAMLQDLFGAAVAGELRAPFALGDVAALRALLVEAGIGGARIETIVGGARFPSIDAWVETDIRGWTLADRIDDAQLGVLVREARTRLRPFVSDDGQVRFACPARVITVRRA